MNPLDRIDALRRDRDAKRVELNHLMEKKDAIERRTDALAIELEKANNELFLEISFLPASLRLERKRKYQPVAPVVPIRMELM